MGRVLNRSRLEYPTWPLPNCWLGTSVEDQAAADQRIPHLLRCPGAVRFLSCEPLLGPVDLTRVRPADLDWIDALRGRAHDHPSVFQTESVDWVIIGGESGPGARPCDVGWIRSLVRQCQEAGVPAFVKQLGAHIRDRNDVGFEAEVEVDVETGHPLLPRAWPSTVHVQHDLDGFLQEYQGAPVRVHLEDRKGGDPEEWPTDLRVREFPQTTEATA